MSTLTEGDVVTYTLRGVDHPYYAEDGCFYSRDCHYEHESWADFLAEMGSSDLDMNLLYRWDWKISSPDDYDEDDPDRPDSSEEHLALFYMQQRKARPVSHRIVVTAEQEQEIGAWLAERAAHMRLLWEPLL